MPDATMTPRASATAAPADGEIPGLVELEGMGIAPWTESETVHHVVRALADGRGGWMVTVNLDILRQVVKVEGIRDLVEQSDLRVADGMPLLWAARVQGTPLPERVCGSNLIHSLPAAAAAEGRSIFLLGGDPGTAEAAANTLRTHHPNLRIAGTHCPEFGFEKDPEKLSEMERMVAEASPDIVFVALGFPKQERLIARIRGSAPKAWWVGVGISFSFASGEVKRAPEWVQAIGLEWVHRTLQEPRRLFVRYFVHDIPFGLALLSRAIRRRGRLAPRPDR